MTDSKFTYANVMSTLAVVIALAGGSTAIAMSAKKNSVTSKSIKAGNVTAKDLAGTHVVTGNAFGAEPTSAPATATCPTGERLIGGGARGTYEAGTFDPALQASYPEGGSWVVRTTSAKQGIVTPFAICLKAVPGK